MHLYYCMYIYMPELDCFIVQKQEEQVTIIISDEEDEGETPEKMENTKDCYATATECHSDVKAFEYMSFQEWELMYGQKSKIFSYWFDKFVVCTNQSNANNSLITIYNVYLYTYLYKTI